MARLALGGSTALLLLAGAACGGSGQNTSGEGGDTSVGIGTNAVGQGYHTAGSAVSSLISTHSAIDASVVPSAGPGAWAYDVEAGTLDFGILPSMELGWAVQGGPGFERPVQNLRTVLQGTPVASNGMLVRQDAGISRIEDLRGRPVATGYGGSATSQRFVELVLASGGLTFDDVQQVPVPDLATGLEALRNGQVEAASGASATTPNVVDAHAARPLEVLPVANYSPQDIAGGVPPQTQQLIERLTPGASLTTVSAGTGILAEDSVSIEFRPHFVAGSQVPADTVYQVLEALWGHDEELQDTHALGQWVAEEFLVTNPQAPYHEGAVRFYRDNGLWTDELEQTQQRLLDEAGATS